MAVTAKQVMATRALLTASWIRMRLVFADCSRAFRGAPTARGGLLRLREVDDRPLSVRVREFFRVRPLRAYGGVVCGVLLLALFARILVSAM